jgi:O-6-methylguanine DNA methyltransferase
LDGERDQRLDGAFRAHREESERGFSNAQRKLEKEFGERHAFYGHVEGPFGPVYLASTARGLCRVSFRTIGDKFADQLFEWGLLPEHDERRIHRERAELSEYLAGRRKRFELPIDYRLVTPFQHKVLSATARIPFGHCVSYSDIASRIGQPEARRAVGGALGKNPIPIVVPCHRVIAADGSIGGYTGGLDIKRALFRIEDIDIDRREV